MLAHEGEIVVASWYGTREATLPLGADFHRRRLTIRSSQVSTIPRRLRPTWTIERRRKEALELCHVLPLGQIPTLVIPVGRAQEAFELLAQPREGGPMHVVLDHG
jgi:threonine dehydrogenase-like Zn-dependent dehydrogenase